MAAADGPNFSDAIAVGLADTLVYVPPTMQGPHHAAAYVQYANLWHEEDPAMRPGVIFYAKDEAEVVKVLKYAREKGAKVAVRTGGHQYSGASSTDNNNILLDLSRCNVEGHKTVLKQDDTTITIRMGINQSLGTLNDWLCGDYGAFVPHGHCSHVHLGGHVQTGGYGHAARAFGLLADHVVGMRVYTADGGCRDLNRGTPEDAELFFAMLGGSPGNFGVLVRIDLRAVRAEPHPNARGMHLLGWYNGDTTKKLLDLLAEWSDDDNLPSGFDYTITVMSIDAIDIIRSRLPGSSSLAPAELPFPPEVIKAAEAYCAANPRHSEAKTIFQKLKFDDADVAEFYKMAKQLSPLDFASVAITTVWVQWANLGGEKEEFDADMQKRFKDIKGTGLWYPKEYDAHQAEQDLSYMSSRAWAFDLKREFHMPFHKRCHITTRNDLARSGYAAFLTDRLTTGVRVDKFLGGLRLVMQTQLHGGKASLFNHGDPRDESCHAWRPKARGVLVVDAFYVPNFLRLPSPVGGSANHLAEEWVRHNTEGLLGPNGCYSREDLRVLWGSFETTPEELDLNADNVWRFYYRDRATVERLRKTKAEYDPTGLLTPNVFSIRPV